MNNTTEIIIVIILFSLVWGIYNFWSFEKKKSKVMATPDKYSKFTVAFHTFYTKLSLFPRLLVSVVVLPLTILFLLYFLYAIVYTWNLLKT